MYIIVAGGGQVGYYLATELIAQEHEVLVIEKNPKRAAFIDADLGNVVLQGDACEVSVLAEAGLERANVVCAVTGDDEDNLVICQVAKRRFNVARTIARINNPRNEQIFRMLGIDKTISSTEVILSVIEQEIPSESIVPLLRMRHADVEIVEATLHVNSPVVGKSIRDLSMPAESILALIVRQGQPIFPGGATVLEVDDEVIALVRTAHEGELRRLFFGRDRA
jgi:trk system potassium uptake protein TrkA